MVINLIFSLFLFTQNLSIAFFNLICWTDCPYPTFVCQTVVSHALYLLSQYILVVYLCLYSSLEKKGGRRKQISDDIRVNQLIVMGYK